MPANQVSGAVGYLVGSAAALALSIGPQAAPAGGCQVRREFSHTDCSAIGTDFAAKCQGGKIGAERV